MLAVVNKVACNMLSGLLVDIVDGVPRLLNYKEHVLVTGAITVSSVGMQYKGTGGWIAGVNTNAGRTDDTTDDQVHLRILYSSQVHEYKTVEFSFHRDLIREATIAYYKSNVQLYCNYITCRPNIIVKFLRGHKIPDGMTVSMRNNPNCLNIIAALMDIVPNDDVRSYIVEYLLDL